MTSFRQIDANRRNAVRSTGLVTQAGKHRSRRNAIRHGLCAETVVGTLEDIDDYRGFEAAIVADYDPETTVERELVLRLASLLWRVRRATAIETNHLLTQADILRGDREPRLDHRQDLAYEIFSANMVNPGERTKTSRNDGEPKQGRLDPGEHRGDGQARRLAALSDPARDLSLCFQRLANFDATVFERLGRYESALATSDRSGDFFAAISEAVREFLIGNYGSS
jgi:hypothetical protein